MINSNRNKPDPITPHSIIERKVNDLRDYSPPPKTYRKYQQLPNGKVVYIGEFPIPPDKKWNFNRKETD